MDKWLYIALAIGSLGYYADHSYRAYIDSQEKLQTQFVEKIHFECKSVSE